MKRKIISIYSNIIIFASAIAAPFLALYDLVFLPTCIWVLMLMIASVFEVWMYDEKEKQIKENEIKKERNFYNIVLKG